MRARLPDREGVIQRDGVRVAFEVFGHGEPALLLIPASPITHARSWKGIVPALACRLARYGAGTCMDYLATDPDLIAARIAELAGQPVSYRDVETDGAPRAARLIAELT